MKLSTTAAFAIAASLLATPAMAQPAASQEEPDSVSKVAPTAPPVADKRDHSYSYHGITISDPYHWLKDQSYPTVDDEDVLDYVKRENAWFEAKMEPRKELVDELFEEMKGRIKEDDSSVPQKDGDWVYWTEFEEGKEYRKWYRRPAASADDSDDAALILDENQLAEGKDYFRLGAFSVSDNGHFLAYSSDDNGSERYTARIKDLQTGALLDDVIPETLSGLTWVAGDTMIAYGKANENWRVDNVRLHRIGTDVADDIEIFREEDEGFRVGAGLSAQEDWLVIATGDNETSEVRLVRADDPTGDQILVKERRKGVEYDLDIRDGTLFIHTNDDHINFRLATASLNAPGEWSTLIAGSDEFYLTDFDLYKDFYATEGRLAGLDQIQIRSYDDPASIRPIAFSEASYVAGLGNNPEYDVDKLRLTYESMVTPDSVYDFHLADGRLELLKQQEIPSGYDASLYTTKRLTMTARDGTQVPVSVLMRKDRPDGPGPLHLYAYGAYGYAVPPGFSTTRLSLVDRGMAYAIAHIRGGDDLGRKWYLQGKLNERWNTFTDFVDVAKGLIETGYTAKGQLSASGGSAGGELMGVVVNTDPDLWGAVVSHVPFVDVLSTMLDTSLPLTPGEWPEWGNPIESKQAFAYILSYSPYDQVSAQDYPPMLVTAGLNDPRVTYWEPAKWVAKLRDTKTDDNTLLLKTNMGAGHGGKSGRFASLYETAEEFAFVLWQLGLED
ncbi:S9 family peptidase [Parerythrobacter jejuensis]|uniref:Prolyl oligopeptidase family serine peptidase n=1 Tax=Parerythrobacter jejuensis TaxID=795812 RepID=A0A845AWH2_9SPHN|nr:S9 family peptidase [Parerythrobacter jejuensis]MXP31164.1 prolyl oligopeptidase family serine peptidase [Parerythrobacter jejuensis]MXP33924.1 prolyl oligopeptidase family serine peptidase [Parerythrobacter jejuensis]